MEIQITFHLDPAVTHTLQQFLLRHGLLRTADGMEGTCCITRGRIRLMAHILLRDNGLCTLRDGWIEPGVPGWDALPLTEPSALHEVLYKLLDDAQCAHLQGLLHATTLAT